MKVIVVMLQIVVIITILASVITQVSVFKEMFNGVSCGRNTLVAHRYGYKFTVLVLNILGIIFKAPVIDLNKCDNALCEDYYIDLLKVLATIGDNKVVIIHSKFISSHLGNMEILTSLMEDRHISFIYNLEFANAYSTEIAQINKNKGSASYFVDLMTSHYFGH